MPPSQLRTKPSAVILNSIAVAFIFELDDLLYTTVLPKAMRLGFERRVASNAEPLSPLATSHTRMSVACFSWLLLAIDLGYGINYYMSVQFAYTSIASAFKAYLITNMSLRDYCMCRSAFLALMMAYLAYCVRSKRYGAAAATTEPPSPITRWLQSVGAQRTSTKHLKVDEAAEGASEARGVKCLFCLLYTSPSPRDS